MVRLLISVTLVIMFALTAHAGQDDYDLYLMHGNPSVELPAALDSYTVTRNAAKGQYYYGKNGSALVWVAVKKGEFPVETGKVKILAVDGYDDLRNSGQAKQIYNSAFGRAPSSDVKAFNVFMGWEMGQ